LQVLFREHEWEPGGRYGRLEAASAIMPNAAGYR